MKGRDVSSHDGITQQIAVGIIDIQYDSPCDSPSKSPLVESPESTKDAWISSTHSPNDNTPIPRSEVERSPESSKDTSTPISCPKEEQPSIIATVGVVSSSSMGSIPPSNDEIPMEDSTMEDDDEVQLLAELEAERLAEEKARRKRRELEERLANARLKKPQSSSSTIPEREGDGDQGNITHPAQDSTSSLL